MYCLVPIRKLSISDIEQVDVVSFSKILFNGGDYAKYGTRFWGKWVIVKVRSGGGRSFALSPFNASRFAQRFAHLDAGADRLISEK